MHANKKMDGFLLIEWLIVVMLLMIVGPSLTNFIIRQNQQLNELCEDQEAVIEKMEIYHQINKDIQISESFSSDKCHFKTSQHNIIYDVKNNRLRRRKKKHLARHFHTIYMGNKDHWVAITCNHEYQFLKIKGIVTKEEINWQFITEN